MAKKKKPAGQPAPQTSAMLAEEIKRRATLMAMPMFQYNMLLAKILDKGVEKKDRTGVGTLSIFAPTPLSFDLSKGFPLVGIKFTSLKNIAVELLWLLSGSTNIKPLNEQGCHIWDEWADEHGELGNIYGAQWRGTSGGKDQIAELVEALIANPEGRRHVVSAWNVEQLNTMALHPCHYSFQCYVANGALSLSVTLRSSDVFLGLPYNIASYALLTHILARAAGLEVGELRVIFTGDAHLYSNHLELARQIVAKTPPKMPNLIIDTQNSKFDAYKASDFKVEDYTHLGVLRAPVAV